MARKGLEDFTERCKVLWPVFSCRGEETACGELARLAVGIPTRVSPAADAGFGR